MSEEKKNTQTPGAYTTSDLDKYWVDMLIGSDMDKEFEEQFYKTVKMGARYRSDSTTNEWMEIRLDPRYNRVDIDIINERGYRESDHIELQTASYMARNGYIAEQKRLLLEGGIAKQCFLEGLTPKHEPSILNELSKNGMLNVGSPLVIDGVNYGNITDCYIKDEQILVKTDLNQHLFSTVNFRNEFNKLHNPLYYRDGKPISFTAYDLAGDYKQLEKYIKDRHAEFRFIEYHDKPRNFVEPMSYSMREAVFRNSDFMLKLSKYITTYAKQHGIEDINAIAGTEHEKNITDFIKCEMVDQGYRNQDKDAISPQALQYVQSLGYSEEAMKEKASIMRRWVSDKDLTLNEEIAARAIASQKIVYAVTDIKEGSLQDRPSKGALFYSSINHTLPASMHSNYDLKIKGTSWNLATGETDRHTIKMSDCETVKEMDLCPGPRWNEIVVYAENGIFTLNFDIQQEYQNFGGFDYQRALEQSQSKECENCIDTQESVEQHEIEPQ